MQHNIQDIFIGIQEKKAEIKDLKAMYKQMLENSAEYQEIEEKMKALKEKKKAVVKFIQEQCSAEMIKISDLKIDVESDQELLNDLAISKYTKGEAIEIKDKYDNDYEPIFVVKFKKTN